ncbi:hypothetical protein CEXT_537811 [Caerostris extrusa]|uniref:Uncharacterized protein n=1 Tax=Caerostris extrusa TaxID=172846 RepID=A0AAV4PWC2_CAEEX|nr:hypothetical protein CEXT_537811 [Caerostris extrusa]
MVIQSQEKCEINRCPRLVAKGFIQKFGTGNINHALTAHPDAVWANDRIIRKSTAGNVFRFVKNIISLSTKKQTASLSSAEAEYISASNFAQKIKWLIQLINNLGLP